MVVAALQQHPTHTGVQEQTCKALVCIARGHDDNQVAMAKARGIHVVVTALQQHLTHVGVQEEACKVLNQLATNVTTGRPWPRQAVLMSWSWHFSSSPRKRTCKRKPAER